MYDRNDISRLQRGSNVNGAPGERKAGRSGVLQRAQRAGESRARTTAEILGARSMVDHTPASRHELV